MRVALLLGEKIAAVGDDQPDVAGAGRVEARIVDLAQGAVAGREPDAARCAQRRTDPRFGARSPTRLATRPAGGICGFYGIAHCLLTVLSPTGTASAESLHAQSRSTCRSHPAVQEDGTMRSAQAAKVSTNFLMNSHMLSLFNFSLARSSEPRAIA